MATVDVTVMGAGIFGLSVAFACISRGAKVQVIDPFGVASGASGGLVGALAPHVPENWNAKKAFQLDSLLMAERYWSEIEDLTGLSTGYIRSGRLQPLADQAAVTLARQREGSARNVWKGHAIWEVIPTPTGEWVPPSPSGFVVRDTLSALIHPRRATGALAAAFTKKGGTILTGGTEEGKVVWATGWKGLVKLNEGQPRQVGNGVKGQAALLQFDAAKAPQLFANQLHIVPHLDGTVAIGSTSERDFVHPNVTDSSLDDIISRAVSSFPTLAGSAVIERWAGVRPRSRTRAPMLGSHPTKTDTFIANGGFKIGFGMAPKVGAVMADLVLDGKKSYHADFDVLASFSS